MIGFFGHWSQGVWEAYGLSKTADRVRTASGIVARIPGVDLLGLRFDGAVREHGAQESLDRVSRKITGAGKGAKIRY
jgi:hypothetical protein